MPQVLNKRHDMPAGDNRVYVGRPTKWGNRFTHERKVWEKWQHSNNPLYLVDTVEEAVAKYEDWLVNESGLDPKELKGKDLVCWCSPGPCHADVLLRLANHPS